METPGGFDGSSGGRIPPITVVSPHTVGMGLSAAPLNTAGVLRSLEQVYGVSYLGDAANANNGSSSEHSWSRSSPRPQPARRRPRRRS